MTDNFVFIRKVLLFVKIIHKDTFVLKQNLNFNLIFIIKEVKKGKSQNLTSSL